MKRLFAALLVFVMVFSMLPISAFAQDNPGEVPNQEQGEPTPTPAPTPTPEPTPTPAPPADDSQPKGDEPLPDDTDPDSQPGTGDENAIALAAELPEDEDYPQNLNDYVYVAIYTGRGFPGEPAWYSITNYTNINSRFEKGSFSTFASSASQVLSDSILYDMVPGTGSGSDKVWGVFSTAGVGQYLTGGGLLDPANEAKIIKAVKGSRVDPDDYRIVWYVIKYQTDTKWHIDGLIVEKETYNVNYYGNGNTSGSAPTGATGLRQGSSYTVLGNTGSMKNQRNGYSCDFIGWNTAADGSGTAYAPGDTITVNSDVTLYAQWKIPTRSISVTKVWDDENNRDGIRPHEVTVHLLRNNVHSNRPMTLNAEGGWTATWTELPSIDQYGNEIDYYIEEPSHEGYTYTVSGSMTAGFTLTNTHRPETLSLVAQKIWHDDNNRDGLRPASVSFRLLKDGSPYGEAAELNAAGSWAYSWHNLPKYENGQAVSYSVEEVSVPTAYTVSYGKDNETGRHLVINTHTPETIDLTASKSWADSSNQDNIRPTELSLRVYANGVPTERSLTLTAEANWQGSITDLPKKANGVDIAYSFVEETPPTGYTVQAQGTAANNYTVTNYHAPSTRDISIVKIWDDNDNQDNIRPESVTLGLYADGEKLQDVTLSAEALWHTTVEDLPVNSDGGQIAYTVTEEELDGYTSTVSGDMDAGFTVTNTHTPATLSIKAVKVWQDDDDRLGNRPDSVEFTLYDNGQPLPGKTLTLSGDNSWSGTWEGLPVKRAGQRISYTVVETGYFRSGTYYPGIPGGYTPTYSYDETDSKLYVATVTNSYTPTTTGLNVQKVWLDNEDQDGKRPGEITLYLYYKVGESGTWTATDRYLTLNAAGRWEGDFTNLPKYVNEQLVYYNVVEQAVEGYEAAEYSLDSDTNVVTVTNRRNVEKISVTVTKVWDDNDNQDGVRPHEVTVRLFANGSDTGKSLTLGGDTLSGSFEGLDKYYRGNEIDYTVAEDAVSGYTSAVTGSAAAGFTVTNRHEPESRIIPVTKVWEDNNNNDGLRPEKITLELLRGEDAVARLELNRTNNWHGLFAAVDKYDKGSEINYTLRESTVTGYTSVVSGDMAAGFTVTNSHQPDTTTVTVSKYWSDNNNQDGKRPDSAAFHLLSFGEHMGPDYKCTLTQADIQPDGSWSHTWTGLPKYKEGLLINYTVLEDSSTMPEGYTAHYERTGNHIKVTNVYEPEKLSFTVQKVWNDANNQDNIRPASIQLQLMAGDENVGNPVTLTAEGHWRYTWTELDKRANGEDIEYRLEELGEIEGYNEASPNRQPTITVDSHTSLVTVTNTHVPQTTSVSVTKVWNDKDNQDGIRPHEVTVHLYQNGVDTRQSATLKSSNGWSYTWENLPVHFGIGEKNIYTVVETPTDGYSCALTGSAAEGFTLTNTHVPEKTVVSVSKVWQDNEDQDGIRPGSLELSLYAGDAPTGQSLTLSAATNWSGSLSGLDKYKDGEEIAYSFRELSIPDGYTAIGDYPGVANAANNYTLINKHDPKLITLKGVKLWEDENDNDGKRPWQVELTLLDNGLPIAGLEPLKLNAANNWQGQWDNMPRYRGGQYVDYTVIESAYWQTEGAERIPGIPAGYTATHSYSERSYEATESTATVTNTYTPETIGLNVQKVWDDDNNRDRLRPDSITVRLWYKLPGSDTWVETDRTAVMEPSNEWDVDFTGLRKLYRGQPIAYNVLEDETPTGYTASYSMDAELNLVTITNTHIPAETTLTVTKVWDDGNDQDGLRPDTVDIDLYADGILYRSDITLSADKGWTQVFSALPLNSNGTPIVWRVYEDSVPTGYTAGYSGSKNTDGTEISITITNSHSPEKLDIPVSKVWVDNNNQDGIRPRSVSLSLYKGSEAVSTISLSDGDLWRGAFTGLDRYENGVEIDYTLRETVPDGYAVDIAGTVADGFTVTNTHVPALTELTALKVWDDNNDSDGKRPDSITVHLVADGEHMGESYKRVLTEEQHGQPDGTWLYKWENLPKYAAGELIEYSVYEEPVLFRVNSLQNGPATMAADRYDVSYEHDRVNNIVTVTNSYIPATVEISAHKVWIDGDNRDGLRPDSAAARLCRVDKGVVTALSEQTLSDSNGWTYQWLLPRYENHGTEIVYTVTEPNSYNGYVNSITQDVEVDPGFFILTSLHDPATTGLSVEKLWDDEEDNDGIRPEGIIVQLYANGEPLANGRVILSANNNYSASWQSSTQYPLYVYEKGELISYSVTELGYVKDGVEYMGLPEGYEDSYSADAANKYAMSITNSHVTEKISVSVEKLWDDDDNNDGMRPEEITLTLLKNGQPVGDKLTLSAEGGWKTVVSGLYRYTGGVVNEYSVVEDVPEGYSADYASVTDNSGNVSLTVTNSHENAVGHYTMSKIWLDGNDRDGTRPDSVTIQLYRQGIPYGEPVILSEANNWQKKYELPLYEDGKAILWTVREKDVPKGYLVYYEQNTLTVINSTTPKTGDTSSLGLWLVMMSLSGLLCTGAVLTLKRRRA